MQILVTATKSISYEVD